MGINIQNKIKMKYALLVAAAAAATAASVANLGTCALSADCKVATDACCAVGTGVAANDTKMCSAAAAKDAAAAPTTPLNSATGYKYTVACVARKGAIQLAASAATVATALYNLC